MNREKAFAAIGIALSLSACEVTSSVKYYSADTRPKGAAGDTLIEYQLATSTIAIGIAAKAKAVDGSSIVGVGSDAIDLSRRTIHWDGTTWRAGPGANDEVVSLVVHVAPSSSPAHSVFLKPDDTIAKTVTLAPVYRENTRLLRELSVNTEDHRKEVIETIGTIAVGVAKLAAVGAAAAAVKPTLDLPIVIGLEKLRTSSGLLDDAANRQVAYTSSLGAVPADSTTLSDEVQNKESRRAIFTSVCRDVDLTLTPSGAGNLRFGFVVADPTKVQTIPLPTKGKVEFGTLCGGNVTIEQAARTSNKELAETLFAQVEALRKAMSPTNKQ